MGIFGKEKEPSIDDLIKIQKRRLRETKRSNREISKDINREKKEQRKIGFKRIVNKIAAKPISRADGMEMVFGVKQMKKINSKRGY